MAYYKWPNLITCISVPVSSCTVYFSARDVLLHSFIYLLFNIHESHYPVKKLRFQKHGCGFYLGNYFYTSLSFWIFYVTK